MEYYLMIMETPIIRFDIAEGTYGETIISGIEIDESKKHLLPITLENKGLARWITDRVNQDKRMNYTRLMHRLSYHNHLSLALESYSLSLTDSYWIKQVDDTMTFARCNLFDSSYSEDISNFALTGESNHHINMAPSPEFTTDGMLPKRWLKVDDRHYLVKGGTLEPYSEVLASQLANYLSIPHVEYRLYEDKYSICPCMTSKEISLVHAKDLLESFDISSVVSLYDEMGYGGFVFRMLMFDCLIFNTDRHDGNFGFLRSNLSGEIIAAAPLYDHGYSLFNTYDTDYLQQNYDSICRGMVNAFNGNFETLLHRIKDDVIFRDLKHFEFDMTNYDRLPILNSHIQRLGEML